MHVYLKENGFVVAGKVWQVQAYLKRLSSQNQTVQQWVGNNSELMPPTKSRSSSNVVPFPHR
ncbi:MULTISPECIES: Z-ring formation inhibitor MciZ [Bacillaceae]|uniref:Z-ring formation inhibitor MciZ n=1 Tax=Alteribacter populi TaxID=2011011 RepID=UPI000BBABA2D